MSLKTRFSEPISRVRHAGIHLSAWGEVYAPVAVCLGHIRAQVGCVAAPSLPLLFPLRGSPSVCSRWALQSAWPGPQMIEGPEPWGYCRSVRLQHEGSEIFALLWITAKPVGCYAKWWTDENLGSFEQRVSEVRFSGMRVRADLVAFLEVHRFRHGFLLLLFFSSSLANPSFSAFSPLTTRLYLSFGEAEFNTLWSIGCCSPSKWNFCVQKYFAKTVSPTCFQRC